MVADAVTSYITGTSVTFTLRMWNRWMFFSLCHFSIHESCKLRICVFIQTIDHVNGYVANLAIKDFTTNSNSMPHRILNQIPLVLKFKVPSATISHLPQPSWIKSIGTFQGPYGHFKHEANLLRLRASTLDIIYRSLHKHCAYVADVGFKCILLNTSPPEQNGRHFGRRRFQEHYLEWKW